MVLQAIIFVRNKRFDGVGWEKDAGTSNPPSILNFTVPTRRRGGRMVLGLLGRLLEPGIG